MNYIMDYDKILNRWIVWIKDKNTLFMDKTFKQKNECKNYIKKHSKKERKINNK